MEENGKSLTVKCWTCGNIVKNAKSLDCENWFCGETKEEQERHTQILEETFEFDRHDTSDNFTPGLLRWEGNMWVLNRNESKDLEIDKEIQKEIQKLNDIIE